MIVAVGVFLRFVPTRLWIVPVVVSVGSFSPSFTFFFCICFDNTIEMLRTNQIRFLYRPSISISMWWCLCVRVVCVSVFVGCVCVCASASDSHSKRYRYDSNSDPTDRFVVIRSTSFDVPSFYELVFFIFLFVTTSHLFSCDALYYRSAPSYQ